MNHPVFGRLRRDPADPVAGEYPWWLGRASIATLAGCGIRWEFVRLGRGGRVDNVRGQDVIRERPPKRRRGEPGAFAIRVNDPTGEGPTAAQENALAYLRADGAVALQAAILDLTPVVRDVYLASLLRRYRGMDDRLLDYAARLIELGRPERVRELLELTRVTFCRRSERGIGWVGLSFRHGFDFDSHGLDVMLHRDRVIGRPDAGELNTT